MRILNVNNWLDPETGGGTAERTYQIARFLASEPDVECSVLTTTLGLGKDRVESLPGVTVLAYPCLGNRFCLPRLSLRAVMSEIRQSDFVHIMGHWTVLNAIAYVLTRIIGKRYVVCPAGALTIFGRSRIKKTLYNLVAGRPMLRNAAACIAITDREASEIQQYGVPENRIVVIPNGIDIDEESGTDAVDSFRDKYDLGKNPLVLFMGRLNPIKGPDLLLEAFKKVHLKYPVHHLVLAGPDDGMQTRLEQSVIDLGLIGYVHFTGYLSGDDKKHAYLSADLLVVPSRREAMSMVALESAVARTPVLLTDTCGFDEVGQVGGGIVTQATAEGISEGMLHLLGDPIVLQEMGRRLNKYVREHHSWHVIIARYLKLYRNLLTS